MIRLDKYLADMGIGTRSEVKQLIRKGMVCVNGTAARKPEIKIDKESFVTVNGELVSYTEYEYYLLNKPAGVVSATEDRDQKTVLDLINSKKRKDLFPVGRLDKDTEGLLLITNDGGLAHRLLSPKKHVDKTYYAKVQGVVTQETVRAFANGVNIGTYDKPEQTLPAKLTVLSSGNISEISLTIQEGKYHQVKRMFASQGMKVLYLRRDSMGGLELDKNLAVGEYRPLAKDELERLQ